MRIPVTALRWCYDVHMSSKALRERARAFTLLELMVVVAVIAILAAILIPNFLHARSAALVSACEENEKHIATAMEEYAIDHGGLYPSAAQLTKPYLTALPRDPAGGRYTIVNRPGPYGAFELIGGGKHDSSVMRGLTRLGTTQRCVRCTTVLYYQNRGITAR